MSEKDNQQPASIWIDRYLDLILAHRWKSLLALLLVILIASSGLPGLYLQADYRSLFKPGNENLIQFLGVEEDFSKSDNVLFVLTSPKGVFNNDVLQAVVELTDAGWQLPFASRVDSLANYQHTTVAGDDLKVANLVPSDMALSPARITDIKAVATDQVELAGRVVSRDHAMTAVNVTLAMPYEDNHAETFEVVIAAQELKASFSERFPELRIEMVGMVAFNQALLESSQNDVAITMPTMFGIITLLLIVLLRSVRATVLTLLVAIASTLFAMGIAGWLKMGITPPTGLTPNIVLIVAVANCVHLFISYLRATGQTGNGKDKEKAVRKAMQKNAGPILLTNLSTAIGFLSMMFSESPPFADLGMLVAIGLVATALMTLCAVPILLTLLPARPRKPADSARGLGGQADPWRAFAAVVTRYPKSLSATAALMGIGFLALASTNELNDNIIQYLSPGNSFREAAELADVHLGGTYSAELALDTKQEQGVTTPTFLAQLDAITDWLRSQPEVTSVNAISDTIKRLNQTLHQNDPTFYRIPESQELVAQYLLLYELSLPYGLSLTDQINLDRSSARIRVSLPSMSSNDMLQFEKRVREKMAALAPGLAYVMSSPTIIFSHMGELNTRSSLMGALAAVFLISLVMGLTLRSLRLGLISLMPNLMPAAIGFGLWALVYGEVGMSLAMVAGMTLGIVVDDTVHFLTRYLTARRSGLSSEESVVSAFNDVGRALLTSTVILTAGFIAILLLSEFRLNSDMGLLTAVIIVVALLFDLILLPALLVMFDSDRRGKAVPKQAIN